MLEAIRRKFMHLVTDPTLRHWVLKIAFRQTRALQIDRSTIPDYAKGLPATPNIPIVKFLPAPSGLPEKPLNIRLPGLKLTILPHDVRGVFDLQVGDLETWLGLQRFAWLPTLTSEPDSRWVTLLYNEWLRAFGDKKKTWAWHPYTVAERAINLIDAAQALGVPSNPHDFTTEMHNHGRAIQARMEYFGPHYTGNHLANNGRGLYRIGIATGDGAMVAQGLKILLSEAKRLFPYGGMLREGSTHYQFIVARWYLDAWQTAKRLNRSETEAFATIAKDSITATRHLTLPGGLPLIGDISPDIAPNLISGKSGFGGSWLARQDDSTLQLVHSALRKKPKDIDQSGWHRMNCGNWSALWFVSPEGWPPIPGHGHQDLGSAEIHWKDLALFIDPGRGWYGDSKKAQEDVLGRSHGLLTIDQLSPYPVNRPYYDNAFRKTIIGEPPAWYKTSMQSAVLQHSGFTRLSGVGVHKRTWIFDKSTMTIADSLDGHSCRLVSRRLITPYPTRKEGDDIIICAPGTKFSLTGAQFSVHAVERWTAYGEKTNAWAVDTSVKTTLPFNGSIRIGVAVEST